MALHIETTTTTKACCVYLQNILTICVYRTDATNKSDNRTNVAMQYLKLADRRSFDCSSSQGDKRKL